MITLDISGPCKRCPYIELDFVNYYTENSKIYVGAHCVHEPVCGKLQDELRSEQEVKE